MNRVYIKTYGCQMNERDSEAVAELLRARGYSMVDNEQDADVILLNTCSVRDLAEQKAIGKAGRLQKLKTKKPHLVLGIMGCMAQNRGVELLDRLPDLDLIVGTQKIHRVPEHLEAVLKTKEGLGPVPAVPAGRPMEQSSNGTIDASKEKMQEGTLQRPRSSIETTANVVKHHSKRFGRVESLVDIAEEEGSQNAINLHLPSDRISAFVSLQQGCNMNCAFCIVPKTRGDERSRPMDEIVGEIKDLAGQGIKEVTLLGQIVTSYGRRFKGRNVKLSEMKNAPVSSSGVLEPLPEGVVASPFVQLLEQIEGIRGIERVRFTSPHPRGFKDDLIQSFGRLPKLCEQVHLPMQSGSDRILRLMNRPYSAERYEQIVKDLRAQCPDIYLSTDIIVGFPGETDEDFEATRDLFERVGFDMGFIFKYSIRSGTPAGEMPDQISDAVKERRNQILLDILEKSSLRRGQSLIGTTQEVLVEGYARRGGKLMGKNRGGRKIIFKGDERVIGKLVEVKVESATVTTLEGSLES